MITRTTIFADVSVEKIFKDENGEIVKDVFDETIPNCDTRKKADSILTKEYPGAIISILDIKFRSQTRKMSDDKFIENSTVAKEEYVDESILAKKAELRKRK